MSQIAQLQSSSMRAATGFCIAKLRGKEYCVRITQFRKLHLHICLSQIPPTRSSCFHLTVRQCDNTRYNCLAKGNLRLTGQLHYDYASKRTFSVDTYNKYFSSDVAPIGFAQKVLESIHFTTGLPWWATIALSTVAVRGLVTLPLAVYSMHVMARVELLQPEIGKLSQELRLEVAMAVKKFAWDAKYARFKYNSTMRKLIKDLYIRDNCHPAKSTLVVWFQVPMWVCLSFALRNMSGAVPIADKGSEAPVLCPDLKTEGMLWFPDLTVPDSTWILPVLLGATNLLNIEMHTLTAQQVSRLQRGIMLLMRLLSVAMIPIGAVVPSCMCYYWTCSSLFGLGQNLLFKVPTVRRLLRLPKTPSESQTPFTDIYNAAKLKYILRPKQKNS